MVPFRGSVVMIGGKLFNGTLGSSVEGFDGIKWTDYQSLPQPLINHTAVTIDKMIYTFGK